MISRGLYFAGILNLVGVPLFTAMFTNELLAEIQPRAFSDLAMLLIMLWGAAYVAVARNYRKVPGIILVFAAEKLIYGTHWIVWIAGHGGELGGILERSFLTGTFLAIYGPIDLSFGIFFLWAFRQARRS